MVRKSLRICQYALLHCPLWWPRCMLWPSPWLWSMIKTNPSHTCHWLCLHSPITTGQLASLLDLTASNIRNIPLIYYPGHAGEEGNKTADWMEMCTLDRNAVENIVETYLSNGRCSLPIGILHSASCDRQGVRKRPRRKRGVYGCAQPATMLCRIQGFNYRIYTK